MTSASNVQWDRPAPYLIVVRGELSDRFAGAFPGMTLHPEGGTTRIIGPVVDQAHLHGVLDRIRGLGIVLISIGPLDGVPYADAPDRSLGSPGQGGEASC